MGERKRRVSQPSEAKEKTPRDRLRKKQRRKKVGERKKKEGKPKSLLSTPVHQLKRSKGAQSL